MFKHHKEFIAKSFITAAVMSTGIVLAPEAGAFNSLPLSYYASRSALSQGHWARIKVTEEGIHQITYNQLRELGFTNPENVKVCGYGGASLSHDRFRMTDPDDIVATKFIHTGDGRIIFYAQADVVNAVNGYYSHKISNSNTVKTGQYDVETHRNYYAAYGCYLLTDADIPTASVQAPYTPGTDGKTLDSHLSLRYIENEVNQPKYVVGSEISSMNSAVFHGGDITGKNSTDVTFDITDYDTESDTPAQMGLSVAVGWTRYAGYRDYAVTGMTGLSLNNATAGSASLGLNMGLSKSPSATAYSTFTGYYNLTPDDVNSVPDGQYTATIKLPGSTASPKPFYQAFDRGWLIYPRKNNYITYTGGMLMYCNNVEVGTVVRISGASASLRVWDVTDNYRVRDLEGRYDSASGTYSVTPGVSYNIDKGSGFGRLIAFDPEKQQLPVLLLGTVPNQNLHGNENVSMLIITTENLYDKAQELAKIHYDYDGSNVMVATQQQIFNEFSSGTPDAMAYRRAAKMLYDRNPDKFKGILIYGKSVNDNRQLTVQYADEKLLVYEALPTGDDMICATVYPEIHIGTDHYFGMLDGAYNPQKMYCSNVTVPVGRLPLGDASTADGVNKKIERYLKNPNNFSYYTRVLLTSDDGDYNGHLRDSNNLRKAMEEANPAMTFIMSQVSFFDRPHSTAPDAAKLLKDALKSGVGFYNYCGHGRPDSFTDNGLLDLSTVNTLDNKVYPFAMISSCNTNKIDTDGSATITQAMVLNPNGGMIAAVGSTRSVYQESNQKLNEAIGRAYAHINGYTTIGEMYNEALNNIVDKSNGAANIYLNDYFNTHCYGLVGDPLIPLGRPALSARVLSINDTEMLGTSDIAMVEPLTKVHITGDICPNGEETVSPFNGRIELRVYDGKEIVSTKHNGSYSQDLEYIEDYDQQYRQLTSAVGTVRDGKWSADIVMPYSTYLTYKEKTQDESGQETESVVEANNRIVISAEGLLNGDTKAFATGVTDRIRILPGTEQPFTADAPVIEEYYLDTPDFRDGALVGTSATVHAKVRLSESGLCNSDNVGESGSLVLDGSRKFNGASAAMMAGEDGYATLSYPIADLTAGRHTLTLSVRDNLGQLASATLSFVSGKFDQRPRLSIEEEVARTEAVIDFTGDLVDATADDRDVTLYITDPKGNTVLKVDNPSFPYNWNLKNAQNGDVTDGNYRAVIRGRLGTLCTYTDPLNFVVIR